jgi:hypothetical protein
MASWSLWSGRLGGSRRRWCRAVRGGEGTAYDTVYLRLDRGKQGGGSRRSHDRCNIVPCISVFLHLLAPSNRPPCQGAAQPIQPVGCEPDANKGIIIHQGTLTPPPTVLTTPASKQPELRHQKP